MGFGRKTDFETGRTLDLEKSYKNIIKPAVIAAGLQCVRADEIAHSGVIDIPMYEHLLKADVVVADLSTSNRNALYELGVRHALRPYTTIVICDDSLKSFPFDVNHVLIRQYHHMGDGIDFEEVERFRNVLMNAINEIYNKNRRPGDSPVYTFLNGLTPPALAEAMKGVATAVAKAAPVFGEASAAGDLVYSELMRQVDEAQGKGDFLQPRRTSPCLGESGWKPDEAAEAARRKGLADIPEKAEDPYLIQRLALVTYKSSLPSPEVALTEAQTILATLNPQTSNDTETLGLWGAIHKRLWNLKGRPEDLKKAVRAYERGFYLRNDYYNGINLAFLDNVSAALAIRRAESAATSVEADGARAEAIAYFVNAQRVRREVLDICDTVLRTEKLAEADKYWVRATIAEAWLGLGDESAADKELQEAFKLAKHEWMKASTTEQMTKLRNLMIDSPVKFLRHGGSV
jgi:hypothetical protein